MYAIFETGGKQFSVTEGQELYVELLAGEAGDTITFDEVIKLFELPKTVRLWGGVGRW